MKLFNVFVTLSAAAIATSLSTSTVSSVDAHSWIACTDYRGDVSNYEPSACKAWPRGFFLHRGDNNNFGDNR
jgi:hypothetical protein